MELRNLFAIAVALLMGSVSPALLAKEGRQLICFHDFGTFEQVKSTTNIVLLSPRISADCHWNELVPSWIYRSTNSGFKLEIRVHYPDHRTTWYHLGSWAYHPSLFPRESVPGQKDADGRVDTDILLMKRAGGQIQVKITLLGPGANIQALKLLTLSLVDTSNSGTEQPSAKLGWGKSLTVIERSQANYPEGIDNWCSPTALSMVLNYWGEKLNRAELDIDVPEIAKAVEDPKWPGTGNWPFNTAFAGSHPGIQAYVTRLGGIHQLETWVASGFPVITSVSYNLLKGKAEPGNGHLIVVIGFTAEGDLIVNDPGRRNVRQIYSRVNFLKAWAQSRNTVYLVYPEGASVPGNASGHWCR